MTMKARTASGGENLPSAADLGWSRSDGGGALVCWERGLTFSVEGFGVDLLRR